MNEPPDRTPAATPAPPEASPDESTDAIEAIDVGLWRLALPSRTLPPHSTTNSYLIHAGDSAVLIDAGFHDEHGLTLLEQALLAAGVTTLDSVLLTHTHRDHCAGIPLLRRRFPGVQVLAHEAELARPHAPAGRPLGDGETVAAGNRTITALHTPGHSPGHLSFWLDDARAVFAGDLVAVGSSVWVGLPEGDVGSYLASLTRLEQLRPALLGPGHGPLARQPAELLAAARRHRLEREQQIVSALQQGPRSISDLQQAIYGPLPERVELLARATLLAHLQKLERDGVVVAPNDGGNGGGNRGGNGGSNGPYRLIQGEADGS